MPQISLGKIECVTPGVPIRATANLPNPDAPFYVHAYSVQWIKTNAGDAYVSLSDVDDRVALSSILAILNASTPAFSAGITFEPNGTNIAETFIDFDNANDCVIISALIS